MKFDGPGRFSIDGRRVGHLERRLETLCERELFLSGGIRT